MRNLAIFGSFLLPGLVQYAGALGIKRGEEQCADVGDSAALSVLYDYEPAIEYCSSRCPEAGRGRVRVGTETLVSSITTATITNSSTTHIVT